MVLHTYQVYQGEMLVHGRAVSQGGPWNHEKNFELRIYYTLLILFKYFTHQLVFGIDTKQNLCNQFFALAKKYLLFTRLRHTLQICSCD